MWRYGNGGKMKSADVKNPASSSMLVRRLSSLLGAHQSKIRVFAAELCTLLCYSSEVHPQRRNTAHFWHVLTADRLEYATVYGEEAGAASREIKSRGDKRHTSSADSWRARHKIRLQLLTEWWKGAISVRLPLLSVRNVFCAFPNSGDGDHCFCQSVLVVKKKINLREWARLKRDFLNTCKDLRLIILADPSWKAQIQMVLGWSKCFQTNWLYFEDSSYELWQKQEVTASPLNNGDAKLDAKIIV